MRSKRRLGAQSKTLSIESEDDYDRPARSQRKRRDEVKLRAASLSGSGRRVGKASGQLSGRSACPAAFTCQLVLFFGTGMRHDCVFRTTWVLIWLELSSGVVVEKNGAFVDKIEVAVKNRSLFLYKILRSALSVRYPYAERRRR